MGIQNFGDLVKGGAIASTRTNLASLLASFPDKTTIGIDMSIILIKTIKASPTIIDLLFGEPAQPIDELVQKTCDHLNMYVRNGFNVVCVFDGMTGPLKANHAHQERYAKNEEKQQRLQKRYDIKTFECTADEQKSIKEVKELRKSLATFNRSDCLHSIVEAITMKFKEKATCIGAPFESDNQMASLFLQGIVDYIATIDSDLLALGTDVLTDVKFDGSCQLYKYNESLSESLPNQIGRKGKYWEPQLLHHCACFLGNDFIGRNPGNSISKMSNFVTGITDEDGMLKGENEIFDYILNETLVPTHCSEAVKQKWNDNDYKISHIKKWKEALDMFLFGPTLFIKPTDDTQSPREALWNRNYSLDLTPINGNTETQWKIPLGERTAWDIKCGRYFLFGFDPEKELRDKLSSREDYKDDERTKFLMKIFRLEVWSKTGKDISPLPDLLDSKGNELFHGSILNFENIPHWCYHPERLKVYLLSRQIKVPNTVAEIRKKTLLVYNHLGASHKPIPKMMMRGTGGYLAVEMLTVKPNIQTASYFKGDEALNVIKSSFPDLNEDTFNKLFGKRNNTRKRAMMHLEGGSFNIKQIKATQDLVMKDDPSKNIILFTTGCTPSQKLKEKNKEKFYEIKVDST